MSEAGRKAILRLVEATPDIVMPAQRQRGGPPPVGGGDGVDREILAECARLDQNDADNSKRLVAHFGRDLAFVARAGQTGGDPIAWTGKFWDQENGNALSLALAQKIGPRIKLEADHLAQTPHEADALEAVERLSAADQTTTAKETRQAADEARASLASRQAKRRAFGVSCGNAARIEAMLKMAGPQLRKKSSDFNAEPLRLATETHTLQFVVEPDFDCPDPEVERKAARVEAVAAFDRDHLITGLVPCKYDPEARAPKWERFLDETMRDPELRRTLQVYSGMGLLGVLAQKLMYHYGLGANGKSVFLAVLSGVIGPSLSVGLPKESILGTGERGAGQASPDLVRLFGKRMLRVDELKDGEPLREDFVKRLVGGDTMIVRNLFGGYFEFANVATPHMSGNGRPRIDGNDNGIWRRMLVMHWSVTIPPERRRPFDEFVADILTERSGILNWLIAGALDFLANGLYEAPAAVEATADYREEMDPIGKFLAQCVEDAPGEFVQASQMYRAFEAWARANGRNVLSAAKVGRQLGLTLNRVEVRAARRYVDIRLTEAANDLIRTAPPPAEPEGY